MAQGSGFATLAIMAVLTAVAIGVQRFGFQAASQTTSLAGNTPPGQIQQFTGTVVGILPLLVLVAGAAVVLSALDAF